jgi:uroporphyrinogen decarboxylase
MEDIRPMAKREVMQAVFEGRRPPYVPWQCGFTHDARAKLHDHFGVAALADVLDNHILTLGGSGVFFTRVDEHCVRDPFGVEWDRSIDQDIGNVCNCMLPEPTLADYEFPDPDDPAFIGGIDEAIERKPDAFRVFAIGFSLYERAWTLRGMERLMMDFHDHPDFVHELMNAIGDFNVELVRRAGQHDIDAVYFGDDWGQQQGLQMGPGLWREFIKPVLARMYGEVRAAGKFVTIHSCGDVDELFDELIEIGLNCFNPFQPEVMDVDALVERYRGRLAFHGGLSTQKTLPYGTPDDVRRETEHLLALGRAGGYIFAPAHAVPKDVPLENMLAFIDVIQSQAGYRK